MSHNERIAVLIKSIGNEDLAFLELGSDGSGYIVTYDHNNAFAYTLRGIKFWEAINHHSFTTFDQALKMKESCEAIEIDRVVSENHPNW